MEKNKKIIKEYMLDIETIKTKFPIGSKVDIDGKECKVLQYLEPINSNYMASYPRVVFKLI